MYKMSELRRHTPKSVEISKFLGDKIDVYWNNENENYVIYRRGKYWVEFLRGENINKNELKRKRYLSNPGNAKKEGVKVESKIKSNKKAEAEEKGLRGKDAAKDAHKFAIKQSKSVTVG